MAANNYAACLTKVLRYEGGYVNDPRDPGGATNYGITIATARANGYTGSMRAIPMDLVRSIYRKKYWDVVSGDALPAGLDLCVFDYAVNSGPARAKKALAAIGSGADRERIHRYCGARLAFLHGLKTWATFGKGWGSRVADVEATALKMNAVPVAPGAPVDPLHNANATMKPGAVVYGGLDGSGKPLTPTPIALPAPDAKPTGKHDGIVAAIIAAIIAAAGAAYTWAMEHLPEIFIGAVALVVLALITYRLWKRKWPWTHPASTGDQSPAPSHLWLPRSAASSAMPSLRLEELSGRLQALHSLEPSAPPRPRKPSGARSPRTRRPPRKSNGSKPSTPKRSSSKRKSRSKA